MYGYYPAGAANDPNAPYNQVDPEPEEFDLEVTATLTRNATINSTEYEGGYRDEEGFYESAKFIGNKESSYKEEHYGLTQLLDKFVSMIDDKIQEYENNIQYLSTMFQSKEIMKSINALKKEINDLKFYKEESLSWDNEELDII